MKISNFIFEVRPHRDAFGLEGIKELVFQISEADGNVRKYRQVFDVADIPDHKSLLDYLFEKAKIEFEKHIEDKSK